MKHLQRDSILGYGAGSLLELTVFCHGLDTSMLETNLIHVRIADLRGRLDALRGYL